MSDQELSDIVAYVRVAASGGCEHLSSRPSDPSDKVLLATGQFRLSADALASVTEPHRACHPSRRSLSTSAPTSRRPVRGATGRRSRAGPFPARDPSWVAARNLTPADDGLAGWSFADFEGAMREGVRPDGTPLVLPMTLALPYTQRLTEVELEALWLYLSSLDPMPTGAR